MLPGRCNARLKLTVGAPCCCSVITLQMVEGATGDVGRPQTKAQTAVKWFTEASGENEVNRCELY